MREASSWGARRWFNSIGFSASTADRGWSGCITLLAFNLITEGGAALAAKALPWKRQVGDEAHSWNKSKASK